MQESQDCMPQGQGYNIVFFVLVYVFRSYKNKYSFPNKESGFILCVSIGVLPWNVDFVS